MHLPWRSLLIQKLLAAKIASSFDGAVVLAANKLLSANKKYK